MKAFKLVHFRKTKSHLHITGSLLLELQDEQLTLQPDEGNSEWMNYHTCGTSLHII